MKLKPILAVAVLLGAGATAFRHREEIMLSLGWESVHPAYYRAVDLAKSAHTLDRYESNRATIEKRLRLEGGKIDPDGWEAERTNGESFLVTYHSTLGEHEVRYEFQVESGRREVSLLYDDQKDADGARWR